MPLTVKEGRKGRAKTVYVEKGDLWLTEADNGLDAVLEFDRPLNLELREIIFERVSAAADVVRVSHRFAPDRPAETILEKGRPYIEAGGVGVFIPAGTFLQPSKEGQAALTALVLKYLGKTSGKIADLFAVSVLFLIRWRKSRATGCWPSMLQKNCWKVLKIPSTGR